MKKFLVLTLVLFISVFCVSCSSDEEDNLNNGVIYYTANPEKSFETHTTSNVYNDLYKDEPAATESIAETSSAEFDNALIVYISPNGKKYHFIRTCPGRNSKPTTLEEAILSGRVACKKCTK